MLRHLRRATASHRTAAADAAHCDTNRQTAHHKVQQRGIAPRPLGKARVATIARPTRYVSTSRSRSTNSCRRPPNDNVSAQVWRLVLKAAHIDFDSKPTGSTCAFVRHPPLAEPPLAPEGSTKVAQEGCPRHLPTRQAIRGRTAVALDSNRPEASKSDSTPCRAATA